MMIQALVAQSGVKLPASMVSMIEAQLRGIGEDFARLAEAVAKGQPIPSRRERRTRGQAAPRPSQAQKTPLPRRDKPRAAGTAKPPIPLAQARRTGRRTTRGPPIFDPHEARALARP